MKRLTINLDEQIHHAFFCHCAKHRKKMTDLIRQAIVQIIDDDDSQEVTR